MIQKIRNYFVIKWLNITITNILKYYLSIVKPKYKNKIYYNILDGVAKDRINNAAFFVWDRINPNQKPTIIFQLPVLRSIVLNQIRSFLQDTITEVLRHEFAHLKYKDEKRTEKWQRKIDLFMKIKKPKEK